MKFYIVSPHNDNKDLGCFLDKTKAMEFKDMCDESATIKEHDTLDNEDIEPLINIRYTYDYNWIGKQFKPSCVFTYEKTNSHICSQEDAHNWIFYEDFQRFEHIYINLTLRLDNKKSRDTSLLRGFVENLSKQITELKISGCEQREVKPFVDQKFKEFVNQKLEKLGE